MFYQKILKKLFWKLDIFFSVFLSFCQFKITKYLRLIFIIFFCFISFSVFAQDFHLLRENTADLRNKLWYWGTDTVSIVDAFLHDFNLKYVERTIATDDFSELSEPYRSICVNLLNRGRNIAIPDQIFKFMIICNMQYGVLIFWWNDTMSFGDFQAGEKVMTRYFFELKPVSQ